MVVDIRSRLLFETELFARRQRRTLGAGELHEMMREAQADAYGDGLDQSTAHPYMWILKPHYYGSHFYNWPYTYGLLFGLGLFARYQDDPERFQAGYDDLLSRAGMDTAEELGTAFGLDVTDEAFWTASLDVIGERIAQYDDAGHRPRTAAGHDAVSTRYDVDRAQLAEQLDRRTPVPARPGVAGPVHPARRPADELTVAAEGAARPPRRGAAARAAPGDRAA